MNNIKLWPREYRGEALVMYVASPGMYRTRLDVHRAGSDLHLTNIPAAQPRKVQLPSAINDSEYEELAGLRKAQAWGAPMFQSGHPKQKEALARLNELQAKECAAG